MYNSRDCIQQRIAEKGHYDPKHIFNTAPEDTFSFSFLQEVEGMGIDSEKLQSLGVPVYRYRTQITIHGIPEGGIHRVYGYKSIVRNLNGSIGVKYPAIDANKKLHLFKYLKEYQWSIHRNSSEFYFSLYSPFSGKIEKLTPFIQDYTAIYNRINRSLFYGQVTLNVYHNKNFGYYAALILNIGAINAANVIPLAENITGDSILTIEDRIREREEAEKKEDEKYEQERLLAQAEFLNRKKEKKEQVIKMYDGKWIDSPTSGVYIQVAINYSLDIIYRKIEFKKESNILYRRAAAKGTTSLEEAKSPSLKGIRWQQYKESIYKVLPLSL